MKPIHLLAAAAAVFASAACDAKKGSEGTATAAVAATPVKAPANGDWSSVVAATPQGGFVMGNPAAKVKLIEFGSMTCPHCGEFDEQGVPTLIEKYVKTGRVAWEFRNYTRDSLDLAAALVTRCNGAKSFFPLTRALYKDQKNWFAKLQGASPEQQQAAQSLGPDRQFAELAKLAGFQQWAAMRGVPTAKSATCLTNQDEVNRLVQLTSDANSQFPDFKGTPSFVINGALVDGATWKVLEPKLRQAIGA
jgi:protein-disulfide isomerase